MEIVCKILSDHGKLQDTFDIKRMLNLLKQDEWEQNPPMAFYLSPLKVSIKEMRQELLRMRTLGPNRSKYYLEENQPLHDLTIKMVKNDVTAQWLMGDSLKNDQLCFIYNIIKIIYQSNLKNKLINKDKELTESVIPRLSCFKGLLVIRNIIIEQKEEEKRMKKLKVETLEEASLEEEKKGAEKEVEEDGDEDVKAYKEKKKLEEEEMKKYGRKWIWQNYISENRKEDWLNVAEDLRHINDHVIQDIQDYILISAFPKKKQEKRNEIAKEVEGLLLNSFKIKNKTAKEEIEQVKSQREFELSLRPPFVWNFSETRKDIEEKIKLENPLKSPEELEKERIEEEERKKQEPYLINHNALPEICYQFEEEIHSNRVSKFMKDLENLTYNLKSHEEQKWRTLTDL